MNTNIFQGTGDSVAQAASSFGVTEGRLMGGLVLVFVFVVVYLVMGKSVTDFVRRFIPNLIPKSTSIYSASKRVWPTSGTTTKLTAYQSQFGTLQDVSYSFNMDLVLKETRTNDTSGLHRHIFHRGSDEYASGTPPSTLPRRMNPGVFLDPLTNDLLIFVDTLDGSNGYRESLRVADLPLGTAFRLGLVLNNRVLDVYINCRLEETKLLKGTPRTVENRLYGIAGPSPAPAQLQNVYCWNTSLPSNDFTALCGTAPAFVVTPTCPVLPPSRGAVNTGSAAMNALGLSSGGGGLGTAGRALTEGGQSLYNSLTGVNANVYKG